VVKVKKRTVKVQGEKYEVREITVQDLLDLLRDADGVEILARAALGDLSARVRLMAQVHDWSEEDLRKMGAGAFMVLDQAFRELNASFFEQLVPVLKETLKVVEEIQGESSSAQ